jgi:hypothetical protein
LPKRLYCQNPKNTRLPALHPCRPKKYFKLYHYRQSGEQSFQRRALLHLAINEHVEEPLRVDLVFGKQGVAPKGGQAHIQMVA